MRHCPGREGDASTPVPPAQTGTGSASPPCAPGAGGCSGRGVGTLWVQSPEPGRRQGARGGVRQMFRAPSPAKTSAQSVCNNQRLPLLLLGRRESQDDPRAGTSLAPRNSPSGGQEGGQGVPFHPPRALTLNPWRTLTLNPRGSVFAGCRSQPERWWLFPGAAPLSGRGGGESPAPCSRLSRHLPSAHPGT